MTMQCSLRCLATVLLLSLTVFGSGCGCGSNPPQQRMDPKTQATLLYWGQLQEACQSLQFAQQPQPSVFVAQLRRAAAEIPTFPASNVDADLIEHAMNASLVLQNLAAHMERSNDPSVFVESFLRSLGGDPFGTAVELNQDARSVQAQVQALQHDSNLLRAVLSSRYGYEFPPIVW